MRTRGPTAGAAILLFFAAIASAQTSEPSAPVTYQPFTAKYLRTYLDEQGGTMSFSGTFYQRSDGSFSRIEETEGPQGIRGTDQYVGNPNDRSWTSAHSYTRTSTTSLWLDKGRFESLMNGIAGTCTILDDKSAKRMGESQFLGVKVIEVEVPMGKTSVVRLSIAPELGCLAVQDLVIQHGEVRTIQQVTAIQFGEPDPSAFRAPADYTEVSPMDFEARWQQLFGQDHFGQAQAHKLEQEYQQGKERQRQQMKR